MEVHGYSCVSLYFDMGVCCLTPVHNVDKDNKSGVLRTSSHGNKSNGLNTTKVAARTRDPSSADLCWEHRTSVGLNTLTLLFYNLVSGFTH